MDEREYRRNRSGNNNQSPGPITDYERRMRSEGAGYSEDGTNLSIEQLESDDELLYSRFGSSGKQSDLTADESSLDSGEIASNSAAIENTETTEGDNTQNIGPEQLEDLGIDPDNLSAEDEQLLAQLNFDWNEFLNVSPERARELLRTANFTGIASGFANELLQYALDQADSAPWGSPLANDSVLDRVKIAPPQDFSSGSDLAQAVVKSEQFTEGMEDEFLSKVERVAAGIGPGERRTLEIDGSDFALNYRDGRGGLQTPRLSLALGFATIPDYTIDVEIWRDADNLVQYKAEIRGVAEDIYDFNNPTDEAVTEDAFARPTRLAFIAQEGGTLAQYEISVDLEETLEGTVEVNDGNISV